MNLERIKLYSFKPARKTEPIKRSDKDPETGKKKVVYPRKKPVIAEKKHPYCGNLFDKLV